MPLTGLLNVTAAVVAPLHSDWPVGVVTVGVGFTVMLKLCGTPPQPLATGVTVIKADEAAVPLLVAVKPAILPEPAGARPMVILLFAQVNTVPLTVPVKLSAGMAVPLHTVWADGTVTFGVG